MAWIMAAAVVTVLAMPVITLAHEGGLELTVSPTDIAAGDEINVSGEGFTPNQPLELHITGPNGDAHLGDVTTDSEGAFDQRIVVPGNLVPGRYLIRVEGAQEASAELSVGAMAGMGEPEEETVPERVRSTVWQATAVAALLALAALGLALARLGMSSSGRAHGVVPATPAAHDRGGGR